MFALLYLLPLGLIFDLGGYMPPSLRLLLIYGLLAVPLCLRPSRGAAWSALSLLLVMGLRMVLPVPAVADIFLLLLVHQLVWAQTVPVPASLTAGVFAYGMLHVFLFLSPIGYPIVEAMAAAGNQLSGWITGSAFHLGYTYQGVGGFVLFLSLSLFGWDGTRVAMGRTASFLLVAVLLNALGSVVLLEKIDFAAEFTWEFEFREVFGFRELIERLRGLLLLAFPAFIFLAQLLAYLLLHHGRRKEEDAGGGAGERRGAPLRRYWVGLLPFTKRQGIVVGAAVLLTLVLVPPTVWRSPTQREIVFVEKGVVSFTKPDYTRFGRAAGGMFGMLPEYARLFGCGGSVVAEIPEVLEADQLLVFTNLDVPLTDDEHRRVWEFVAAGGRLWVLGDHTFIKNDRNHINDFLAPCGIELKNDSAQFHPQGWFHSYRFYQGTPFGGLRDDAENRPGILVGASLDLGPRAQPLVAGRFAYSDWGLSVADGDRGYLGDFVYQAEERLGDLVLVAGESYGKGKVLVFGDTSSFFSNNLSRSYEILRASLSWLGESNGWSFAASPLARIVVAVMLIGFCVLVFVWRSLPASAGVWLVVGGVSLCLHGPGGQMRFDKIYARDHLAVIDFSHQPYTSKHSSMDTGLHGVSINLMRYGLLPATVNEWDEEILSVAGYVILNAPRRPFTAGERRDLKRFMERGGTVILGCGHFHYSNCRSLLEPLGLRVRGLPLGRFFDRVAFGRPVSFFSAWPIEVIDRRDAAVLCVYDNWPLMVSVPQGRGRLVLIGDSEFLHNRNLEGHENHDPANTTFLKNLFDYVTASGGVGE